MNWRISALDRIALVSNSDSHSPLPSRLGREFNVFDLVRPSYGGIFNAIKNKDKNHFLYTVEVPPEYGKYHYTGHRACGVFLNPKEAVKINNICPVCNRKLTVGVMQRVEELADRPEGYVLKDSVSYKLSLPLYEIISYIRGTETQYSRKIEEEQLSYIKKAGSEISLLLSSSKPALEHIVGSEISNIIERLREKKIDFEPGYDGVYGKLISERKDLEKGRPRKSSTLDKYFHK